MVEEFNLLDLLSDGRAVFSAGRGYDQGEYTPFGASFGNSRAGFDEQMGYMMAAWRESPLPVPCRYYSTPQPPPIRPRAGRRARPAGDRGRVSPTPVALAAR